MENSKIVIFLWTLLNIGLSVCGGESESTVENADSLKTCITYKNGIWEKSHTLLEQRSQHLSWSTKEGVYLLGGSYSPHTAEFVPKAPMHSTSSPVISIDKDKIGNLH